VESSITGAGELLELAPLGAVALVPAGWPAGEEARLVPLDAAVTLPLLAIRAAGPPSPAVARLLALPPQPNAGSGLG
jgi:hypothetical protein